MVKNQFFCHNFKNMAFRPIYASQVEYKLMVSASFDIKTSTVAATGAEI